MFLEREYDHSNAPSTTLIHLSMRMCLRRGPEIEVQVLKSKSWNPDQDPSICRSRPFLRSNYRRRSTAIAICSTATATPSFAGQSDCDANPQCDCYHKRIRGTWSVFCCKTARCACTHTHPLKHILKHLWPALTIKWEKKLRSDGGRSS
jgi:hypothetical protein